MLGPLRGEASECRRESKVERVGVSSVGGIVNGGGEQKKRGHERRRLHSARYGGNPSRWEKLA